MQSDGNANLACRFYLVQLQASILHHSQAILKHLVGSAQPADVQLLFLGKVALGGGLVSRRPLSLQGRLVLALQSHDEGRRAVQLLRQLQLASSAGASTFYI